MRIVREHTLGIEEARRRVDQVAEELSGKLGLSYHWVGDHLEVNGTGVSGRIIVEESRVEVHVTTGLAMTMFREPIRNAIENSIDHFIV